MCLGSASRTTTIFFSGPPMSPSRSPFSRWPRTLSGGRASQRSRTPTPLAVGRSSIAWESITRESERDAEQLLEATPRLHPAGQSNDMGAAFPSRALALFLCHAEHLDFNTNCCLRGVAGLEER